MLVGLPLVCLAVLVAANLEHLGIEEALAQESFYYVLARGPAQLGFLLYFAGRAYLQALGKTKPLVLAAVVSNCVNLVLDILLVFGDDGLAPAVGENLRKNGFVLTCSSYVVGDGVKIELGQNDAAWTETYKTQPSLGMPDMGNAAAAKALRVAAEKDVPRWTRDIEKTLEKS